MRIRWDATPFEQACIWVGGFATPWVVIAYLAHVMLTTGGGATWI